MKSLSKNMIVSVLARVVTLITGLIVQRKILITYGSSLNGLTSSITQVMSYLVILEAGLGTASIQALYSPLAQNDWNKISGIIVATGREYKKISALFFVLLMGVSFLLPLAVQGEVDFFVAGLLTLLIGASYMISYILGGKYKVLLTANRELYILNELDMATTVLSCVLRVLALGHGYGIVFVQVINLICVCLKNLGYFIYVRVKYKRINYLKNPDYKAVDKRWNVLLHNLAGIVVNHTDVVILTIFANLKIVSVYSVYNMVFSQLSTTIQSTFMTAPQANFGRLFNHDRKQFEEVFGIYETVFIIFLFIVTAISLIMILPFVSVYTNGVTDINYMSPYLPILFALILLMNQVRVPIVMTINVAGTFKETQNGAIIEAIINLIVSLTLFFLTPLGLYGLLIGTICSYIYRTTDVILFTYKYILYRKIQKFMRTFIVNFILLGFLYFIFNVCIPLRVISIGMWIFKACSISVVCLFTFIMGNYLLNRDAIIEIILFGSKKLLGGHKQ